MRTMKPALLLASLFCMTPLLALATDDKPADCKPDQVWAEFLNHERCYAHGDKAPDPYTRSELGLKDWQARGLPAPDENSQWVEITKTYVLINRENSVIKEIRNKSDQQPKQ